VLLPVKQSVEFFTRWSSSPALRDAVKAVLLDDTGESPAVCPHQLLPKTPKTSPAQANPQAPIASALWVLFSWTK
jgi:hypothetical protein